MAFICPTPLSTCHCEPHTKSSSQQSCKQDHSRLIWACWSCRTSSFHKISLWNPQGPERRSVAECQSGEMHQIEHSTLHTWIWVEASWASCAVATVGSIFKQRKKLLTHWPTNTLKTTQEKQPTIVTRLPLSRDWNQRPRRTRSKWFTSSSSGGWSMAFSKSRSCHLSIWPWPGIARIRVSLVSMAN